MVGCNGREAGFSLLICDRDEPDKPKCLRRSSIRLEIHVQINAIVMGFPTMSGICVCISTKEVVSGDTYIGYPIG